MELSVKGKPTLRLWEGQAEDKLREEQVICTSLSTTSLKQGTLAEEKPQEVSNFQPLISALWQVLRQ